jgi:hypothetical protein
MQCSSRRAFFGRRVNLGRRRHVGRWRSPTWLTSRPHSYGAICRPARRRVASIRHRTGGSKEDRRGVAQRDRDGRRPGRFAAVADATNGEPNVTFPFEARWRLGQLLAKVERPERKRSPDGAYVASRETGLRAYLKEIGLRERGRPGPRSAAAANARRELTKGQKAARSGVQGGGQALARDMAPSSLVEALAYCDFGLRVVPALCCG